MVAGKYSDIAERGHWHKECRCRPELRYNYRLAQWELLGTSPKLVTSDYFFNEIYEYLDNGDVVDISFLGEAQAAAWARPGAESHPPSTGYTILGLYGIDI